MNQKTMQAETGRKGCCTIFRKDGTTSTLPDVSRKECDRITLDDPDAVRNEWEPGPC